VVFGFLFFFWFFGCWIVEAIFFLVFVSWEGDSSGRKQKNGARHAGCEDGEGGRSFRGGLREQGTLEDKRLDVIWSIITIVVGEVGGVALSLGFPFLNVSDKVFREGGDEGGGEVVLKVIGLLEEVADGGVGKLSGHEGHGVLDGEEVRVGWQILLVGGSEVTREVSLFRKPVHGLHARGVVEVDPIVGPVAAGSGSVAVEFRGHNIVNEDSVIAIVVVGDLALVLGWIGGMNLVADFVDAKGLFGPLVMSVHVIKSGLDEGGAAALLVEHEDAAAAHLANLDFLAFRRILGVDFGRGEAFCASAAAPPLWIDRDGRLGSFGRRGGGSAIGGRGLRVCVLGRGEGGVGKEEAGGVGREDQGEDTWKGDGRGTYRLVGRGALAAGSSGSLQLGSGTGCWRKAGRIENQWCGEEDAAEGVMKKTETGDMI